MKGHLGVGWFGLSLLVGCAKGADCGDLRVEAETEGRVLCVEEGAIGSFGCRPEIRPDPDPDAVTVGLNGELRLRTFFPEEGSGRGAPSDGRGTGVCVRPRAQRWRGGGPTGLWVSG